MTVTVIGDALVDIIVPIFDINPGETHHRNIISSCGGASNVAIKIAELGEETRFIGKVGRDVLGTYFKENLKHRGVKDLSFVDESHATGICVSIVYKDGERAMVSSRGANDYLTKEDTEHFLPDIQASSVVYFSGYSLQYNLDVIIHVIKQCQGKCTICFNPGAPNLVRDDFRDIAREFVDILILNIEEARSMTGEDTINEIKGSLANLTPLSVITTGRNGCIVVKGNEWTDLPVEHHIQGADTTGAGDAFCAGFLVGRLRGMDDTASARFANKIATSFLKEKEALVP